MSDHGTPCWFELSTAKGQLSDAEGFYARLFGWEFADAGMPGFTYHLGRDGGDVIVGAMEMPPDCAEVPPNWMIYVTVDDADATAARIVEKGGSIFREPADIPGTGRFAIASDPQGTAFGILQPEPMEAPTPDCAGSWNQQKAGRGNWIELMSTDPVAGFDFYADLFGWTRGDAMDMGEMGTYQLFRQKGVDIGGMMGLGAAPSPNWLAYFGVDDVAAALEGVRSQGGTILHGPTEVPGPALIAVALDPQGAAFAVVGPKPEAAS